MPKKVEAKKRNYRFTDKEGIRRNVYLGMLPDYEYEFYKRNLEKMVHSYQLGSPNRDVSLSNWLQGIDDDLHAKIAKAGLCKERATGTLLGLVGGFIERRKPTVKKSTMVCYEQAKKKMLSFFGEKRNPQTITKEEAQKFATYLRGVLQAEATVDKVMRQVKVLFNDAVELELIKENVFKRIRTNGNPDENRNEYLSQDTIDNIIENGCPNAEWRLLLALLRYGGMRMPSETMLLRWQDVDFTGEKNWLGNKKPAIRFRTEKTKHHRGGGMRTIPIFGKILPHLEDVSELATARATQTGKPEPYVFWTMLPPDIRLDEVSRGRKNFRTCFCKILKRMNLDPWPKLFQNLRRSCRNDLERCGAFTPKTIDAMLGHSSDVAAKHYSDVLPDDFSNGLSKVFTSANHGTSQKSELPTGMKQTALMPENADWEELPTGKKEAILKTGKKNRPYKIRGLTQGATTNCKKRSQKWAHLDSNQGPQPYQDN
ncbi:MAG: phage integrase SAM-like domain-containing protein [Thermoguttaceae bacterium]